MVEPDPAAPEPEAATTPARDQRPLAAGAEDAQLIASFLDGQAEAVRRVQGWVEQALRSYPLRSDVRQDVVQEALLEITSLLKAGAFRGEARLKTYLWKVSNHVCLNQLRAQSRHRWASLDRCESPFTEPEGVDHLARLEARDRLDRVARLLSPECRTIWELIAAGLSYREMGARLGLPEGALRVRAHRCRKRALALWEELTR